jgi:hypothetical protein
MTHLLLMLFLSLNSTMAVTVLESVPNSPFVCSINENCSGSIVRYKDKLFILTANHCMTLKQDKIFCGYKDDGTYDYTVEIMPSVLACSGALQQMAGADDFAIYGIKDIYSVKTVGKAVDKSKVPALILPDPDSKDVNQLSSSYFEEKAGQTYLKDAATVECRAAGFGRLITGEVFGTLRSTKIPKTIQGNTVSSSNWIDSYFVDDDKNKMILFSGDSGGPLYCKPVKDSSANWYILGIAASAAFLSQETYASRHYNKITASKEFKVNSWSSTINTSFINDIETAFFQAYPTACVAPTAKESVFTQSYSKSLYGNDPTKVKVMAFKDLAAQQGVFISSEESKDGSGSIASYSEKFLFISDAKIEEDTNSFKITIKYTDKPLKNSGIVRVTSKTVVSKKAGDQYYCTMGDLAELEFINTDAPKITMKDCVIVPNEDKKIEIKKGDLKDRN